MQTMVEQWQQQVLSALNEKRPLRLRGGGTKDWYGQSLQGEVLDTRAWRGIVAYQPEELVVTARCGTPLMELEAALAAQGQMLPFEPPHFALAGVNQATVGGMLAAGLAGPRRLACGSVRDFVLGVQVLDGRGQCLNFGGQVMKNVAGYDVSRTMAGALGTLGMVLQVSFKVLPCPAAESSCRFGMTQQESVLAVNQWLGQALPISASCWLDGQLTLRFSGARAAVQAALQVSHRGRGGNRLELDEATAFWRALREQQLPFFADAGGRHRLWRVAVPALAPALDFAGPQLIEWGGAQRWLLEEVGKDDAQRSLHNRFATSLRAQASALGGHATLFRAADKGLPVFQAVAPALAAIQSKVQACFDPARLFNPARIEFGG